MTKKRARTAPAQPKTRKAAKAARQASKPASEPEKRGRGRPSKFTLATRQRILNAIRAGNYLETAAAYGLVHYDTLNEWLKFGDDISRSLPAEEDTRAAAVAALAPIEREYLEFSDAVKEERAKAEMEAVMSVRAIGQGRPARIVKGEGGQSIEVKELPAIWQANAWFLERSFPDRWGRRVIQKEISGPGGKAIAFKDETAPITDAERMARLTKLLQAAG